MKFYEVVDQVLVLLQRKERVSYRALKREFDLDDEYLEDLKAEIIDAQKVAVDEAGKVLVWTGGEGTGESENRRIGESETSPQSLAPNPQSPANYTPFHLADRIRAEQAAMEARGAADGERKTITALFADLKGSTALIEGLDPEEARAIIDPALQLMMDAVHRYEGYVAQALGDGIFALFGAPIAHEDHPQRALYAALRMQEEMRRYSDQLRLKGGTPLYMRVGINTGEVVVRSIRKDDLHTDYVPVGHATNLVQVPVNKGWKIETGIAQQPETTPQYMPPHDRNSIPLQWGLVLSGADGADGDAGVDPGHGLHVQTHRGLLRVQSPGRGAAQRGRRPTQRVRSPWRWPTPNTPSGLCHTRIDPVCRATE